MEMMSRILFMAAAGGESAAGFNDTTGIVVIGFLFVLVVLALLASITAAIGAVFASRAAKEAKAISEEAKAIGERVARQAESGGGGDKAPGGVPAPGGGPEVDVNDPAVLAVIASAIHCASGGRPHRVVSIRPHGQGWAQEGRRQIFSSHRVR